jgi:hypothetical protein
MKTTTTPLTPQETKPRTKKCCQHCQKVLPRFLVTLAMNQVQLCARFQQHPPPGSFKTLGAQGKTEGEMQKRRWHRQNALRRFLATLAVIGCIIAPYFDGTNPQGVQWDSLESFRAVGGG